jgi:hypothetical protein
MDRKRRRKGNAHARKKGALFFLVAEEVKPMEGASLGFDRE